ncbi:hypothetical protein BH10PLA2_BH10PLA2_05010 [soil metagenome]
MTQSTLRFLIGGLLTVGALASLARGDDKAKPELLPPPHCPMCSQKACCCTPDAACCEENEACCEKPHATSPILCVGKPVNRFQFDHRWHPSSTLTRQELRVFPVNDLLANPAPLRLVAYLPQISSQRFQLQDPLEELIELIQTSLQPESWNKGGGPGTIEFFPVGKSLVINQSADMQEQVQELLNALRRLPEAHCTQAHAATSVPACTAPLTSSALPCGNSCQMESVTRLLQAPAMSTLVSATVSGNQYSKVEREILRKLEEETVNCDFKDTPLRLVIEQLTEEAKLNYVINVRAIMAQQPDRAILSDEVTMRLKGARLKSAFALALHLNHLTYKVENDALVISPEIDCTQATKSVATVTNVPSAEPVPNVYPNGVSEIPPRPESSPVAVKDWQAPSVILIQPANIELAGMASWALGTLAEWMCEGASDKNPPPTPLAVPQPSSAPVGYTPAYLQSAGGQPNQHVPATTFATGADVSAMPTYGIMNAAAAGYVQARTPTAMPSPSPTAICQPSGACLTNATPTYGSADKACQTAEGLQHPIPGQLQSLQFRKPKEQPSDVNARDFRAAGVQAPVLPPAPGPLPVATDMAISPVPAPVCENCPTPQATPIRVSVPALGSAPVAFDVSVPTPTRCEDCPTPVSYGKGLTVSVPLLGPTPIAIDVAVPLPTPQVCEVPQAREARDLSPSPNPTATSRANHWSLKSNGDSERPTFLVQSPGAQMVCEQLRLKAKDGASLDVVAGKKIVHLRGKNFEAEAESIEFAEKEGKLLLVGSASLTYRDAGKTECAVRGQKLSFEPNEISIKISGTDR